MTEENQMTAKEVIKKVHVRIMVSILTIVALAVFALTMLLLFSFLAGVEKETKSILRTTDTLSFVG